GLLAASLETIERAQIVQGHGETRIPGAETLGIAERAKILSLGIIEAALSKRGDSCIEMLFPGECPRRTRPHPPERNEALDPRAEAHRAPLGCATVVSFNKGDFMIALVQRTSGGIW